MEWVHELFQQYGYYVVLVGLLLEYIALPFPGEPTLAYAGFLAQKGDLSLPILIILSFIGTSLGMTIQYFLGNKLGMPFIQKYGKYVFLTQRKIDLTRMWFDKYGYFLIFIGFFIMVYVILQDILQELLTYHSVALQLQFTQVLYFGYHSF